jgi:hypothetical protein
MTLLLIKMKNSVHLIMLHKVSSEAVRHVLHLLDVAGLDLETINTWCTSQQ